MRLSDKLAKFIMNDINDDNKIEDVEEQKNETVDKEDEIKEEKEENKKTAEEKKLEKAKNKISKLYDALTKIKEQLEDKKLSPFKRLMLQLKLNLIETRLDRQLAKFELKEFKEKMDEIKDRRIEELNSRIEPMKEEYDSILDRKFELEEEIEDLLYKVDEREIEYEKINSAQPNNKSKEIQEPVYEYRVNDDIKEELKEKQRELENIISQKEEKEEEILDLKDEFQEKIDEIERTKNNKLIKYNPLVMTWGTIRTFFERAGKTIKNWINDRKEEKQAVKEAMNKAKEETTEEFRNKAVEDSNTENDKTIDRIKNEIESKEDLKENNDKEELKVEEIEQDDRNAEELTAELIERIKSGQDTEGLPKQIVERITKEARENVNRTRDDFKNSLKSDKTYEEQREFAKEIQEQKDEEELDNEYDENQFTKEELDAVEISPDNYMMRTSVNKEKMEEILRKGEADRRRRIKKASEKEYTAESGEPEFDKEEIRTIQNNAKNKFAIRMHNNAIQNLEYRMQNSQDEEEIEEYKELIERHKESIDGLNEKIVDRSKNNAEKDNEDDLEK